MSGRECPVQEGQQRFRKIKLPGLPIAAPTAMSNVSAGWLPKHDGWLLHDDPHSTLCSDPLESMRSGAWTRSRDAEFCRSRLPALRVLCSSNASDVHASTKHAQGEVRDRRPSGLLWHAANCSMRHFSAPAACELLRANGGLLAVGDSTMRHLFMGFLSVVSDDYDRGAVSQDSVQRNETLRRAGNDSSVECRGDLQFSSNLCRRVRDLATSPIAHCPGVHMRFAERRHAPELKHALSEQRSNGSKLNSDSAQLSDMIDAVPEHSHVIVRLGVHENFNASSVEAAVPRSHLGTPILGLALLCFPPFTTACLRSCVLVRFSRVGNAAASDARAAAECAPRAPPLRGALGGGPREAQTLPLDPRQPASARLHAPDGRLLPRARLHSRRSVRGESRRAQL